MDSSSQRTYPVTGATSGIGEAAAVQLAHGGARVLLGARTAASGDAACRRVHSLVPEGEVDVVVADLSEMTQVRSLADDVHKRIGRLDGVILNAGATTAPRPSTSEGFNPVFATNFLSGYYLTRLLLPLLHASAPARIVVVSSSFHARIKHLDVEVLTASQATARPIDYEVTKLLDVLFVTELAVRLGGTGLIVNTADPGFVRSNLGRNATGACGLFLKAARPIQDGGPHSRAARHLARHHQFRRLLRQARTHEGQRSVPESRDRGRALGGDCEAPLRQRVRPARDLIARTPCDQRTKAEPFANLHGKAPPTKRRYGDCVPVQLGEG